MSLRIKFGLTGIGLCCTLAVCAQWAPLGALPMQYNSSFAGETGGARAASSFTFVPGSKTTTGPIYNWAASYDQFVPAIGSGVGLTANWSGTGNTSYPADGYYLTLAVAPKFSFKGKYTLSPSLDFSYGASEYSSGIGPGYDKHFRTVSSRIALLFNTDRYYIGYSVNIINRTNALDSSYNEPNPSGFYSTLQVGYTFRRSAESKFSFTPQVLVRIADKKVYYPSSYIQLTSIILNFKYKRAIWGVNSQGIHVGWQTEKLRLMLSNYWIWGHGDYSANLSIRYLFNQ